MNTQQSVSSTANATSSTAKTTIIPGAMVAQSVEDFYKSPTAGLKRLNSGTYDMNTLTNDIRNAAVTNNPVSIFVSPNTSIKLTYIDGSARIVTNGSTHDDIIHVSGKNVKQLEIENITSSPPPVIISATNKEQFMVDTSSVTFTYFDLLVVILIGLIIYNLVSKYK
jgi:hypothetical protein